jgi:hypothetical protein
MYEYLSKLGANDRANAVTIALQRDYRAKDSPAVTSALGEQRGGSHD